MNDLNIGLWAINLQHAVAGRQEWVELVEQQLRIAAQKGIDMLLAPEHLSESWINYAPAPTPEQSESAWVMAEAEKLKPLIQEIVHRTGVAFLMGSSLYRDDESGQMMNRAWLFFPDRAPVYHDKLVLTPAEKASTQYCFAPGNTVRVFNWRGWRLAMVICLDIELPALGHILSSLDIDLLLVPAMTTKQSGFYRVFSCARARAIEIMSAVAVVACAGGPKDGQVRGSYNGGAAVYVPSEETLGSTGVFAEIPVHNTSSGSGQILYAQKVPLALIRSIRHGQPEAWPGAWPADHIRITDEQ